MPGDEGGNAAMKAALRRALNAAKIKWSYTKEGSFVLGNQEGLDMEKEIDELGSGWDAAKERIVQLENEVEAKDGEINQLGDMNKGPWEARGLEG
jgi:hypothetical protein